MFLRLLLQEQQWSTLNIHDARSRFTMKLQNQNHTFTFSFSDPGEKQQKFRPSPASPPPTRACWQGQGGGRLGAPAWRCSQGSLSGPSVRTVLRSSSSGVGHLCLAEGDGQLQILLLLLPQPLQPLPLHPLALPLGPFQLLRLVTQLQRRTGVTTQQRAPQ